VDCVVVGGGVIGCAIALALRDAGADVVVVDRGPPGEEASSAAAGILAPQAEAQGPGVLFDLLRASRLRWPAFARAIAERSGVDVGYRTDGALVVAHDAEEAERLTSRARWQREAGLAVELVDARALAALEPALAPATLALHLPDDHQVDGRRVMRALINACDHAGVDYLRAEVRRLRHDGSRVLGVDTDGGARDAARVVVAAGAWSALVDGVPLGAGAIVPVRGQMIELRMPAPPLRHVVFGDGGYLVPRADGRVLCGSTEERVGFAKEVTADGIATLCARAARLCPALDGLPVADSWAGLRPASADALPYVGATAIAGLYVATGHFRNGVLLAPLTAEIVAALVTGGTVPVDVTALSPSR
jgi:glycine oxidase